MSFVYAGNVAVTYPYSAERPLVIAPGDEVVAYFTLLNVVPGNSDATVTVSVSSDELDVNLVDDFTEYFVPFGERVDIPVSVGMPDDALLESQYTVSMLVREVGATGEGAVAFAEGIELSFPVVADAVSASPEPVRITPEQLDAATRAGLVSSSTILWFVLVVALSGSFIAVAIVLVRAARRRRTSNSSLSFARFSDGTRNT